MEKPRHPHDHFFRQSFGLPEVALDYLRNFLPSELAKKLHFEAIERVEGSFVSRKLRTHISDIIYRCPLKSKGSAYLTFLFEHKSKPLLFYRLEGTEEGYPEINYIRMLLVYILCTTDFNDQDWEDLVENTPPPVKHLAMTTYDMLIKKGLKEGIEQGIELGIEQGIEKGIEVGEEKKARKVVLALVDEFPEFSNARIARLAEVTEEFVQKLRG